jgi:hypothetical protein
MSYDLAVWAGARPADDQSAAKEFEQRCDQRDADIDRGIDHPPSPVIERFAADLLSRWPELDDDSGDECPWSDAPLIGNASGNFFHFAMTFTGATERYDTQKFENLQIAAARLEAGKTFDATPKASAPKSHVFLKSGPEAPSDEGSNEQSSTRTKLLESKDLESWYRYGDSNPGSMAENHVS